LIPNLSPEHNKEILPYFDFHKWGLISRMALSLLTIGVAAMNSGCTKSGQESFPTSPPVTITYDDTATTQLFTAEISNDDTATNSPTATLEVTPTSTSNPHDYTFPVRPDKSVDFSEGTAAHGYPATDIFAPAGWEYVAVTDGTVEFISYTDSWDPVTDDPGARGGIAIAIIGDDGLRYYGSHLLKIADGIETGQHVSTGQLLGYIGESGNASGKISHLHFGISRPTYPEDWKTRRGEIDPFPYLNAWAAWINVTPRYSTPTPKPNP
jgi:murein DD-endopeptidase MepM/ murein hydrolase activator NlpD